MGVAYIFYNTGMRRRTDMKVGFIGGGNMASAMIGGMIQKELYLQMTFWYRSARRKVWNA